MKLDGWMIKPPDFDPKKKYPVLVYVYGEPAGATVTDAWGGSRRLFHALIARQGYLVVSFDNQGTPAPKGREWRKIVYGDVGVLSSVQQAEAIRELAKERAYIDSSRLAIWGWSGGGSNTLNMMFRYPGLFKAGIAVAPVADQRHYDTIYQERYMGLPQENAKGYHDGSPINFAAGPQRQAAGRSRLGRRQRAFPGDRAADQPAGRAGQAIRHDGLSQSHPLDLRGTGNVVSHAQPDRALSGRECSAGRSCAVIFRA